MRFLLGGGLTLVVLVSVSSVEAQDSRPSDEAAPVTQGEVATRPMSKKDRIAEAKKAFAAATRAYAEGDFETSLARFRRAHELTDSPDLLYNIATVADRMRHDDEALEAYEGYLEARPNSPDAEHVQGRIDALRLAIEAREMEARQAALEAAARIKAERPLTQYVGPGPGPWITIGAGSATVVSGVILLGLGQSDQNKVESAPPGSSYEEVRELAERGPKRTKAGVALMAVGGAAVVGGIIWQFKGGHEEAIPEVSIGPSGISIRGKF